MASSSCLGHSSAKSAWVFQTQARSLPAFGFSSIIGVTRERNPMRTTWLPSRPPLPRPLTPKGPTGAKAWLEVHQPGPDKGLWVWILCKPLKTPRVHLKAGLY